MIDSGLGGLSLFIKHIRQTLPNEDIISFADSKYIPYGDKIAIETIRAQN